MKNVTKIIKLAENVNKTYFEIGHLLAQVQESEEYNDYGYEKFSAFIEGELPFRKSKAHYLIRISRKAEDLGLTEDALQGVGWSKAREILSQEHLTREEVVVWLERSLSMPFSELCAAIKPDKEGPLYLSELGSSSFKLVDIRKALDPLKTEEEGELYLSFQNSGRLRVPTSIVRSTRLSEFSHVQVKYSAHRLGFVFTNQSSRKGLFPVADSDNVRISAKKAFGWLGIMPANTGIKKLKVLSVAKSGTDDITIECVRPYL
jgi:hypothetical protein